MTLATGVKALAEAVAVDVKALEDGKVDKEPGKGLSESDYTTEERTKLAGIATEATKNRADTLNADKAHNHTTAQVTGLDTVLADKADKTIQVIAGTGLTGGGTLAAHRILNVRYGTSAGTAAQGNDSRLSNSREWTAAVVSQAEAEAGTSTTARKWTAQRVRQAISALGLKIGTTASTAKAGNWTPTWTEVSNKPSTFAPDSHTHSLSEVTDAGSLAALNTNASTANFLRGDGTWVTPPNTTYSEISTEEISSGTASTGRTISGRRMKYALDKKSDTGHTHPWSQVTEQPATATRWPTLTEVTGKPTNYPTNWATVTEKPATATRWPTLTEVTGKPTNYPTNWATVSNKPIVQTVGSSTTDLMSQKAVTGALAATVPVVVAANATVTLTNGRAVYAVNTTSAARTLTLPANPPAGATVTIIDYANTCGTNKLTIARNGRNIEGAAANAALTQNGQRVEMVYIDAAQGWKVVSSYRHGSFI